MDTLLEDALGELFRHLTAEASPELEMTADQRRQIANEIDASGFADLLLPQAAGGSGISLREAMALLKMEGYYNLPVPFAQTVVARAWAHAHNVALPKGTCSYAGTALQMDTQTRSITLHKAWHGQWIDHMLIATKQQCFLAHRHDRQILHAYHGGLFAAVAWPQQTLTPLELDEHATHDLLHLSVLAMLAVTVGAMEKAFALTVDYASQRQQFGRPVSRFQAVQHQISEMAEHVCAADMALQMAADAEGSALTTPDFQQLAIAQFQIAHIADNIADIAHAIHGAIGISQEYPLHRYTRRIRECKSCFGSAQYWAAEIGRRILHKNSDSLFAVLTSTRDEHRTG
ncbi:MAG TPA: acyl-CoA dehydrogenase family protein [Advenella sp.]|nr:acyl-CoA dehydrogenase family protein [Advenella sp.]